MDIVDLTLPIESGMAGIPKITFYETYPVKVEAVTVVDEAQRAMLARSEPKRLLLSFTLLRSLRRYLPPRCPRSPPPLPPTYDILPPVHPSHASIMLESSYPRVLGAVRAWSHAQRAGVGHSHPSHYPSAFSAGI